MPPPVRKPEPVVVVSDAGRPILYPPESSHSIGYRGDGSITSDWCKETIGWIEDEKEALRLELGKPLLKYKGRRIWCANNVTNRPIYMETIERLKEIHLTKRWKYNGEPIILGVTGMVLDGQHTMFSLIFAEEERTGPNKFHWEEYWDSEVTMEKLVVFGIEEDDDTVNTINTGKPRSLTDVIYRSEFFQSLSSEKRKIAAQMTSDTVMTLWARTGTNKQPWAPKITHSACLEFIAHHPKMLEAVRFIMGEESKRSISQFMRPGYAAAFLYLMASCTSDGETYKIATPPSENHVNFDLWDRACEFWAAVAKRAKPLQGLFTAIADLINKVPHKLTKKEYFALFSKAWLTFNAHGDVKPEDIDLEYSVPDDEGNTYLLSSVNVGGIDFGDEGDSDQDDGDNEAEVEERKAEVVKQKSTPKNPKVDDFRAELAIHSAKAPGCLLLYHTALGNYVAYEGDAAKAVKAIPDLPLRKHPVSGLFQSSFSADKFEANSAMLMIAGHQLAIVNTDQSVTVVPSPKPKPHPKPTRRK